MLNNLEDSQSDLSRRWDAEHDDHVLRFALEEARSEFTPQTWRAFYGTTMEAKSPRDVALELEISENAVRIGKSRVTARVREIVHGLLD
jgi:RNA polymerase sigma-70 factor (ECF subfamily)